MFEDGIDMSSWKEWETRVYPVEKSLTETEYVMFVNVSGIMISEMMLDVYDDDYCRTHNLSKEEIEAISKNYGRLRELFENASNWRKSCRK